MTMPNIPNEAHAEIAEAEWATIGREAMREMALDIKARADVMRGTSPDAIDRRSAEAIYAQAAVLYRALGRIA